MTASGHLGNPGWDLYYTPAHVETLMRRFTATGNEPVRLLWHTLQFHGCITIEKVHPLQGGYLRRKDRLQRRAGLPVESPLVFYPRRLWEVIVTQARFASYFWRLQRLVWKVKRDPERMAYQDLATTPVADAGESEELEMFAHSEAARAAVAKAKKDAAAREKYRASVAAE